MSRPSICVGHARSLVSGAGLVVASLLAAGANGALAQPDPSFRSTCAELRAAIEKLGHDGEQLVTIQVVGALTSVHFDGTLAYMVMCSPPDPQVMCVTYGTSGRKAGEVVVFSGGYSRRGPDHVLLDPCLHSPPDDAPAR